MSQDSNFDFDETHPTFQSPAKRSFWQKLGGGSLSISLILHILLLVAGLFWIFQINTVPEKKVDFMPKSGGGGSPASASQQKKQQMRISQPNMARVSAVGAASSFVLPEPEESSQMTSISGISSGSLAAGLGGHGSGGGKGDGNGTGVGNGLAPGMSTGNGTKNPFGAVTLDPTALAGSFYDLKQTRAGKPTDLGVNEVETVINDFVNRGWRESAFNKYFKAPQTLYQSKLYIPAMSADSAPAAFNCADQVQPSRWVVVYRGMITPPRTGKYRLVGYGDDVLVVRFNNRNIFDHGYFSGTTMVKISSHVAAMKGEQDDPEVKKMLRRDYPMPQPLKSYTYETTKNLNGAVGGLGIGPVFEAEAGKNYPIDILLSELPGGVFCASLLIEEVGVDYPKAPGGSPILPIFRFDNSLPPPTKADNAPPYDPNGPVWKVVAGREKSEI